jgi:hypothetical protein
MFLKFSPQLPQLMPLLASASAYFAIDCARKFFRPGLRAQSFHDFFYKTGRVSLLSTYSRILLLLLAANWALGAEDINHSAAGHSEVFVGIYAQQG